MRHSPIFVILIIALLLYSCKEEILPKPKAMLRLDYENSTTSEYETEHYLFELSKLANVSAGEDASLTLDYPSMKGSIFITYKTVDSNIESLLSDAQKLSYEHVVKADDIIEQPFVNDQDKVYGMYYEVRGNAASQAQFYVTDSVRHFVTGSLYFYAKPNYDSIYPAAVYLQKDIRKIMESLKWKK